ncbi:MAG: PEP-CTERM sorting domain-containing protein [Bryobacteraceae bacterium]
MRAGWIILALAAASALPLTAGIISVDPNGNGTIDSTPLSWTLGNDPGPGGLDDVLTYSLPFQGTQGDVLLTFSDYGLIPLMDVRFNGDGTLILYAANVGGPDLLADTDAPPGDVYGNLVELDEPTVYASTLATYTPGVDDPGYDASNPTYQIFSYAVPEPGTPWLVMVGLAGLAARWGRSSRHRPGVPNSY